MTAVGSSSIKAIDGHSVHKITSGQVVVDLQTAVKELVENSLDAGATNIEVRFRDCGLKTIEVQDNGSGIAPEDYDSIGLKHHTSKLSSFEDLTSVMTFGFRGEAISSLCAMSESVSVITATASEEPMGTIVELDRNGRVANRDSKVARKRGTTFTVTGLFKPLAVRRKELERNAKRDFAKALNLLSAYALVPCAKENHGVRLTVSNQEAGKKNVNIRTDGSPSIRASVSALWGPKSLENLVELNLEFNVEAEKSLLRRQGILDKSAPLPKNLVKVSGLISKFTLNCGRNGTDRQFFFVNGRPCNPSKVQKAFNEVYRTFNINQSPVIIADFTIPTDSCDINVSPDKRTILLHSEANLIQTLKTSLEECFSSSRSTFDVNDAGHNARQTQTQPTVEIQPIPQPQESVPNAEVVDSIDTTPPIPESHIQSISEVDHQSPAEPNGRSREKTPLFVPSRSPSPTINDVSEDTPMITDLTSSPVPTPSLCRDSSQSSPPSKKKPSSPAANRVPLNRFDSSHPGPRVITTEDGEDSLLADSSSISIRGVGERKKRKDSPQQTVLDTSGAFWNLRKDKPRKDVEQPSKRQRISEDDREEGQPVKATEPETTASRKKSKEIVRKSLWEFAMPGSQAGPSQPRGTSPSTGDEGEEMETETTPVQRSEYFHKKKDTNTEPEHMEEIDELAEDEDAPKRPSSPPDIPAATAMDVDSADVPLAIPDTLEKEKDSGPEVIDASPTDHQPELEGEDSILEMYTDFGPERVQATAEIDISKLAGLWAGLQQDSSPENFQEAQPLQALTFADEEAGLQNANEETAAKALSRVIAKDDFNIIDVIGQFNKGFIIARRQRLQSADEGEEEELLDDLFIVDQHAADEKYNFEDLQQNTKLQAQKFVRPQPLRLSAAEEILAMDNLEVLQQNGFDIEVNEDENRDASVPRLALVGRPISKSTVFDMKDLEELLYLMQDRPKGQMVRCSKTRAMLASRACRKSIMVGNPLTNKQMTSVIRHMSTMDQPWNCPHGRPTMRHLCDLSGVAPRRMRPVDLETYFDRRRKREEMAEGSAVSENQDMDY